MTCVMAYLVVCARAGGADENTVHKENNKTTSGRYFKANLLLGKAFSRLINQLREKLSRDSFVSDTAYMIHQVRSTTDLLPQEISNQVHRLRDNSKLLKKAQ